jgi:hypothetical protein
MFESLALGIVNRAQYPFTSTKSKSHSPPCDAKRKQPAIKPEDNGHISFITKHITKAHKTEATRKHGQNTTVGPYYFLP